MSKHLLLSWESESLQHEGGRAMKLIVLTPPARKRWDRLLQYLSSDTVIVHDPDGIVVRWESEGSANVQQRFTDHTVEVWFRPREPEKP